MLWSMKTRVDAAAAAAAADDDIVLVDIKSARTSGSLEDNPRRTDIICYRPC